MKTTFEGVSMVWVPRGKSPTKVVAKMMESNFAVVVMTPNSMAEMLNKATAEMVSFPMKLVVMPTGEFVPLVEFEMPQVLN